MCSWQTAKLPPMVTRANQRNIHGLNYPQVRSRFQGDSTSKVAHQSHYLPCVLVSSAHVRARRKTPFELSPCSFELRQNQSSALCQKMSYGSQLAEARRCGAGDGSRLQIFNHQVGSSPDGLFYDDVIWEASPSTRGFPDPAVPQSSFNPRTAVISTKQAGTRISGLSP